MKHIGVNNQKQAQNLKEKIAHRKSMLVLQVKIKKKCPKKLKKP